MGRGDEDSQGRIDEERPAPRDDTRSPQSQDHQFRALVDAVEEYAIFRLDPKGNVVTWNPGAEQLKGYSRNEILGEHFSTFYTDADRAAGVPGDNLVAATEDGSTEDEGWRVRADGSQFWANVTITAIRDADGSLDGFAKVTRDMTERYQRERELESELERILGRISDAFYALDENFQFRHVNAQAEELLGYSDEELRGEVIWDVFPQAAESELYDHYKEALETQETVSFERNSKQLGIWAEVNVYPSETGLSIYITDITERKEREEELERTLDLLHKTERTANVGGWEIDPETLNVFWSDHLFELLGVSGDEEPPLDEALEVYHEADRAIIENTVEEALAKGDPFDVEVRFRRPSGEVRWLRVQGDPETVDDDVVSLRGAAQDITERKRRERELEQRAHQQQVVADLGQFALETEDLDELMHEAARQVADVLDNEYCKVLDLDPDDEELLLRQGVGWDDGIVGEATVSSVEADSQAAYTLANEHPIVVEDLETETRFSGPDLLTSHDVRSGISTIIGSIDEPWGILGTHDTDRREFTDEDVSFVQSVANVLAEAIQRHRYQAELEEIVKQLEESNERLEQFAYAASHDLQEPLRMVSSYLQLLERRYADDLDEDAEEFIDYAVDGADRMKAMIEALLDYSRVETDGEPLEPIELDAVLDDVLTDLQFQIEENDAEITTESLPRVEGDASQLRQVFQNLVDNALEYSGDDPPRVHVSADRDGSKWIISVEDEGIGIEAEDTDRIFDVFQRLHTLDEHEGTGIGLALCQRIVERHGGEIWVDSEPDRGSTFSFTLPAYRKRAG